MIFALTYWYVDSLSLEIYFPFTDLETKPASLPGKPTCVKQGETKELSVLCSPASYPSSYCPLQFCRTSRWKKGEHGDGEREWSDHMPLLIWSKKKKPHWSLILDKTEPFSSESELSWSAKIRFFPWKLRCCPSLKKQEPTEWTESN